MKTKTQLEKEIKENEKLTQEQQIRMFTDLLKLIGKQNYERLDNEVIQGNRRATLTQTNAIIELIEKTLDYYDNQPAKDDFNRGFEHCCNVLRKEILNKLKGNEDGK